MIRENKWVPVTERLPEVDKYGCSKYILLSFENFTIPAVGRYEVDKDGSGAFYEGDEDRTLVSYGVFVNAWMPLPKCYREEQP